MESCQSRPTGYDERSEKHPTKGRVITEASACDERLGLFFLEAIRIRRATTIALWSLPSNTSATSNFPPSRHIPPLSDGVAKHGG